MKMPILRSNSDLLFLGRLEFEIDDEDIYCPPRDVTRECVPVCANGTSCPGFVFL